MIQLETDFTAVWDVEHVEFVPPHTEVRVVDGEVVWSDAPSGEQRVSGCIRGLSADNWEDAIQETRELGYPFCVKNTTLVDYDDDDGECLDCEVIGLSWRAVNAA